jgi:hypothetical protein
MEYLGAWGTLIHEKNLKSKISCQTPFIHICDIVYYLHWNIDFILVCIIWIAI